MSDTFDLWIVVEGHYKPGGSTSWCNDIKVPVRSTDGCHEFMLNFQTTHSNVIYYSNADYWESKDEQVNKAISLIPYDECILWQVDADEVWGKTDIELNETVLLRSNRNCGRVQFTHIVGEHEGDLLVARGKWGSGYVNRVWKWKGEEFISHEPSVIRGQRSITLPKKFDHYSMYFEQDVKFKSKYYKGYERLYENWKEIHRKGLFPCHAQDLLGKNHQVGARTSRIFKLRR